jgi:DNA (cytosine-5)-methyltransferase 1
MKILNLYSGIGGNRKLWSNEHEITSIEFNSDIAAVYAVLYPNDKIIIADAKEYLLQHYNEFDFIWASPPCQSHSRMRQFLQVQCRGQKAIYPDISLYEIIIFLQHNFNGKWVVENVKPYYEPLIKPTFELQRHFYWSNFKVEKKDFKKSKLRSAQIDDLQDYLGINLSSFKISNKRQVLRNCVLPEIGNYILKNSFLSLYDVI